MNSIIKVLITQVSIIVLLAGSYFGYRYIQNMGTSQDIRCEGKNLSYPETFSDCVDCHSLKTPDIVDYWYDSKHGIMLVKCGTCHGDPSGEGENAFRSKPGDDICAKCHGPAVDRMKAKHENRLKFKDDSHITCITCHPFHQNPIHRNAYEKVVPSKMVTF